jgi:hypothetical protein
MKYFVPKVKIGSELPLQDCLEEKFGGLPWGLNIDQVPVCSHCGKHQTLVAQLLHHPVRLDLGGSGRVLFVFMCEQSYGGCPSWQGGSGANACFVLEPHELGNALTDIVYELCPPHQEVRILDWYECEDGISPAQVADFYNDDRYCELPEALIDGIPSLTKIAGVPSWCQSANETPEGWQFVAQIEESHHVFEIPPGQVWGQHIVDARHEQPRLVGDHNFGSGSAYVFLRYQSDKPEGWFFWQC